MKIILTLHFLGHLLTKNGMYIKRGRKCSLIKLAQIIRNVGLIYMRQLIKKN